MLWYLGIWLFYFRRKGENGSPPLPHRWQGKVDELPAQAGNGLIGQVALEQGVTVLEADEFSFAELTANDAEAVHEKSEQLGLVADVQQEIKSVCAVLAQKDGNKEDFFSMLEMVKAKYPKIKGHPATAELGTFIREHVPFHLSQEELENLWS